MGGGARPDRNRHFDEATLSRAKSKIDEIAKQVSPTLSMDTGDLIVEVQAQRETGLVGVVTVPVSSLQGVADAPTAINNVSRVLDGIATQLQFMPQILRWETELLLLDLESYDVVVQARENMQQFADAASAIERRIDGLPEMLDERVDHVMGQLDTVQPELHAMLEQGETITTQLRETTANVNETVGGVQELMTPIEDLASAWGKTVVELRTTIEAIDQLKGEPDRTPSRRRGSTSCSSSPTPTRWPGRRPASSSRCARFSTS